MLQIEKKDNQQSTLIPHLQPLYFWFQHIMVPSKILHCFFIGQYRLCQKKLYNLVLNIKNCCRIIYPSHFTVWIIRFFSCKLIFVSFKLDIHKLRYCYLFEPINFLLVLDIYSARYPYLNCIDGIEQQTNKISVKWINRFKQWVWLVNCYQKVLS